MEDPPNLSMIIVLVLLVICSAFFSASETAYSTLNRIRIKNMAEGGNKRAATVLKLYEKYDNLLSTILIGNNIVNIANTALATVLFVSLYGDMGATISTVVVTVVVLIFGEISPKTMAKEQPEQFALFAAPILQVLMVIFTPVNALFSLWKLLLSKLIRSEESATITEGELLTMVEEAEQEGAIDEGDRELIHSVIEFNDHTVEEILTPRVDITAVSLKDSAKKVATVFTESGFSRLPVYDEDLDDIVGVIHLRDFFESVRGGEKTLKDILTPAVFITHNMKISELLKLFQSQKIHLAVVADEYGGTEGMVTMEDVLEELVGEIWDETDEITEDFTPTTGDGYVIDCSAELTDFLDFFSLEGEFSSSTVSGWIMEHLNKVAEEGDSFDFAPYRVTVTKTDHRRVTECLMEKIPDEET